MIQILYRDSDLVVCVKPVGVLSQDSGEGSMPALLRQQLSCDYVAVLHRLDRDVGGVMVYALQKRSAAALSMAIQQQKLVKRYYAVLCGTDVPQQGILKDLLFHDKQKNKTYVVNRVRKGVKEAVLEYTVVNRSPQHTLVRILLHTGRTHQIRVQFASRRLPLVGDVKYGGRDGGRLPALWSYRLQFSHPITGKVMDFACEPPPEGIWKLFIRGTETGCISFE